MAFRNTPVNPLSQPQAPAPLGPQPQAFEPSLDEPSGPEQGFVPSAAALPLRAPMAPYPALPSAQPPMLAGGMAEGADDGLDDYDLTFGSLPRVVLKSGSFFLDQTVLGTMFEGVVRQKRYIYAFRDSKESKANVVWSYDRVFTTKREPLEPILTEWRSQGKEVVEKRQAEVYVLVTKGHEAMIGRVVMCSMPEVSVSKFNGHAATVKIVSGARLNEVLTRFSVGPAVTNRAQETYTPWMFTYVGKLAGVQQAA